MVGDVVNGHCGCYAIHVNRGRMEGDIALIVVGSKHWEDRSTTVLERPCWHLGSRAVADRPSGVPQCRTTRREVLLSCSCDGWTLADLPFNSGHW